MNRQINSGAVQIVVMLCVLLAGALGFVTLKPKMLHGDSRRAAESTAATTELINANKEKEAVLKKKSAEAAASAEVMGSVVGSLPETPEKSFLTEENKVIRSKLEAPDSAALLEAEKRKVAVLSGQIDLARQLYGQAFEHAKDLEARTIKAEARATKAETERSAVDLRLEQIAAERLGAERTSNRYLVAIGLLVVLYAYTKITHLSPGALAEAAKDIAGGVTGQQALDNVTTRLQQKLSRFYKKHF